MSFGDAYVRVWCDRDGCGEEIEVPLPFVYIGPMHALGCYDHSAAAVNKRVAREPDWIVTDDGRHYCSTECADPEGQS